MPITYTFNKQDSYIHCQLEGDIAATEVVDYVDQISADARLDQPFVEIIDLLQVTTLGLGYNDASYLQPRYKHLPNYRGSVFVAKGEYLTAVANLFVIAGEGKELSLVTVDSLEEAIAKVPEVLHSTS